MICSVAACVEFGHWTPPVPLQRTFTALSHPDITAIRVRWWVRRGSHSRPSEARRKWCHSCPDDHDSLVSSCSFMLPYIWIPSSHNRLPSATITVRGKALELLAYISLNIHFHVSYAWKNIQSFIMSIQGEVYKLNSFSQLTYKVDFSVLLASYKFVLLWSVKAVCRIYDLRFAKREPCSLNVVHSIVAPPTLSTSGYLRFTMYTVPKHSN